MAKKSKDEKEQQYRANYFRAHGELREYLSSKFGKYLCMPVKLKPSKYPEQKERIGWYDGWDMPTVFIDQRLHKIKFTDGIFVFFEEDFEVYKGKIKDKNGDYHQFVDVKCPHCSHVDLYDLKYLVWKYNCNKCRKTVTTNDRVEKKKFNENDFR